MHLKSSPFLYFTVLSTVLVAPSASVPLPDDPNVQELDSIPGSPDPSTELMTGYIHPEVQQGQDKLKPMELNDRPTPSALAFAAFMTASGPDPSNPSPPAQTFSVISAARQVETPMASTSGTDPSSTDLSPTAVDSTAAATPSPAPKANVSDPDVSDEPSTSIADGEPTPAPEASTTIVRTPTTVLPTATSPAPVLTSATVPHVKPSTTILSTPTNGVESPDSPKAKTQAAEKSRNATIIGIFLALATIFSFMVAAYCLRFRLPCFDHRSKGSRKLSDEETQDNEGRGEKRSFDDSKNQQDTVTLPVLPSLPPPAVTNRSSRSPDSPDWSSPDMAHFEDFTAYLSNGPFTEVSLSSVSEIRSSALSDGSTTLPAIDRASIGASSVAAASFSTSGSRYSNSSNKRISEVDRVSALIDAAKLKRPEEAVLAPSNLTPKTRVRSKTLTEPGSPPTSSLSSSKSFPENFLMMGNRWSQESSRSRKTDRSSDSEWDVAQAYGRFSKDSVGGHLLSTIDEDSEFVESFDVGGKRCLLVKGAL